MSKTISPRRIYKEALERGLILGNFISYYLSRSNAELYLIRLSGGGFYVDLLGCAIVFYIKMVYRKVFYIGDDAICVFIDREGSGIPRILLSVTE